MKFNIILYIKKYHLQLTIRSVEKFLWKLNIYEFLSEQIFDNMHFYMQLNRFYATKINWLYNPIQKFKFHQLGIST